MIKLTILYFSQPSYARQNKVPISERVIGIIDSHFKKESRTLKFLALEAQHGTSSHIALARISHRVQSNCREAWEVSQCAQEGDDNGQ